VSGLVEVSVGVLVRTGVAATDVAAREAHPQVRPGIFAVLDTFSATRRRQSLRLGGIDGSGQVLASLGRGRATTLFARALIGLAP
jgi:hypothetical protein